MKYEIPGYFNNEKDEICFWQNYDQNKKMKIMGDIMAEYYVKKYGKIPRLERVVTIRKMKKIK